MTNPRLVALFDDYASSHQHPTNRLTHKVAIPFIVLHIVAMLDWVKLVAVPVLPGGVAHPRRHRLGARHPLVPAHRCEAGRPGLSRHGSCASRSAAC